MKLAILGAPGAGKGTRAQFIIKHYGIPHISTGDLLRDHLKRGTDLGKEIFAVIEAGQLVSDDIMTLVLRDRLSRPDCSGGFLLDGYPRTITQAHIIESIAGGLDKVVSVDVPDELAIERISGRRICGTCGAIFHMSYRPPKAEGVCDSCGGALVQRDDDSVESLKVRLDIYHKEAEPVVRFFQNHGKLVSIDGRIEAEDIADALIEELEK